MEYKKLGDICDVVSGGTPSRSKSQFWNGDIPWLKIGNIRGKYVSEADEFITEEGLSCSSAKMLKKGTILYTIFATLGEAAILTIEACTNQAIAGITIKNEEIIDRDYLYYYLKSKKNYVNDIGRGVAQNNINMSILRGFEVPIREKFEQKAITDILNKIGKIIEARKEGLNKLDNLIKARFVELFGDPKANDKGFTKAPMGEYMTVLSDFSSNGSYKTLDSGVTMYDEPNYAWMVRTTDLESGDMSSIKYIDENAYELLSKSKIYGGEIIMNKIGSAGKVYLMPEIEMPASLGRNAFMFRYDDRINVRFLFEQLVSEYGQAEIQQYVRGAVTKTITKDDARSVQIIVPEKELQDKYAEFVHQIDKSKVVVPSKIKNAIFVIMLSVSFGQITSI